MSSQITNNNYMTTLTSPNPYITRKLNNMDKAKAFKEERDDWTRLYQKTLKGLEMMIDVQKQVWDMMKIAEEANMTITEIEEAILKASINNQTTNAMNILGILEDLLRLMPPGEYMDKGKGYDDMIGCAICSLSQHLMQ